jgi:hypothetical protein
VTKNIRLTEYRNYFNNFKKSLQYKELQSYLITKQLSLCINCKKVIALNKYTHCYHLLSLNDLVLIDRKDLVINYNNFYLSCNSCNLKQSKNSNFSLLSEDVFKLISLVELAKIVYLRNYKLNIKHVLISSK